MTATAARLHSTPRPLLVTGGLALSLTLLLALSARLEVPFWPVPMTLQTMVALAIAGVFGARVAGATMLAYLLEGALGLPVFAGGAGVAYLAGPTGGYLAGMLVASLLVGELARRARGGILATGGAMLAGIVLIYAMGAAWLASFVGIDKALVLGVMPFLVGDVVKTALATAVTLACGRR